MNEATCLETEAVETSGVSVGAKRKRGSEVCDFRLTGQVRQFKATFNFRDNFIGFSSVTLFAENQVTQEKDHLVRSLLMVPLANLTLRIVGSHSCGKKGMRIEPYMVEIGRPLTNSTHGHVVNVSVPMTFKKGTAPQGFSFKGCDTLHVSASVTWGNNGHPELQTQSWELIKFGTKRYKTNLSRPEADMNQSVPQPSQPSSTQTVEIDLAAFFSVFQQTPNASTSYPSVDSARVPSLSDEQFDHYLSEEANSNQPVTPVEGAVDRLKRLEAVDQKLKYRILALVEDYIFQNCHVRSGSDDALYVRLLEAALDSSDRRLS